MPDPDSKGGSRWGGPAQYTRGAAPAAPDMQRLQSLYQQALAALLRGRADLAAAPIDELRAAAPPDPKLGQLIEHLARNAAAISFQWPARREPFTPARREPPAQEAIDLVAFHVDLPRAPSGIHAPTDYMGVLALSFESARLRAPRARRILITDETTAVPDTMPVDEVRRFALDATLPMFERTRVQGQYLRERAPGRLSVLMDSDVVVNADPVGVFAEAFDVGLTWRPEFADAPFNGGMIFVAEGDGGARLFASALACYEALAADPRISAAYPTGVKAWWGDQFAWASLVGYRAFAERTTQALAVDGIAVRFFPCADYNFTLEPDRGYPPEELRRKYFIHFKGNRKALQAQYLEHMRRGAV
jgi:hypothetical protein